MAARDQDAATTARFGVRPAPAVGAAMVIVYIVVVFGLQFATGLSYREWTDTAAHGIRAGIIPLAVGSVILIAFIVWSRWDTLWEDPRACR